MNKYIALFIAPLVRSVGKNYAYTDKWKIEDMKSSVIYLPVTKNGLPNWEYIERYMKSIEKKTQLSLNMLTKVIGGGVKTNV